MEFENSPEHKKMGERDQFVDYTAPELQGRVGFRQTKGLSNSTHTKKTNDVAEECIHRSVRLCGVESTPLPVDQERDSTEDSAEPRISAEGNIEDRGEELSGKLADQVLLFATQ